MSYINKSNDLSFDKLTEEDVKYQYIIPAIENAGWDKSQLKFEFAFTDGKMHIQGKKVIGVHKNMQIIYFCINLVFQ